MKKLFSLLLSVLMILSVMPMSFAANAAATSQTYNNKTYYDYKSLYNADAILDKEDASAVLAVLDVCSGYFGQNFDANDMLSKIDTTVFEGTVDITDVIDEINSYMSYRALKTITYEVISNNINSIDVAVGTGNAVIIPVKKGSFSPDGINSFIPLVNKSGTKYNIISTTSKGTSFSAQTKTVIKNALKTSGEVVKITGVQGDGTKTWDISPYRDNSLTMTYTAATKTLVVDGETEGLAPDWYSSYSRTTSNRNSVLYYENSLDDGNTTFTYDRDNQYGPYDLGDGNENLILAVSPMLYLAGFPEDCYQWDLNNLTSEQMDIIMSKLDMTEYMNNNLYITDFTYPTETLIFANGITEIPFDISYGNRLLKNLVIPEGVKAIPLDAFGACTALEHVILPNSLEYIASRAFRDCTALQDVHLGPNVEYVGWNPFDGCSNITSMTVDTNNEYYSDGNGSDVILDVHGNIQSGCMNSKIPAGCVRLNDSAFDGTFVDVFWLAETGSPALSVSALPACNVLHVCHPCVDFWELNTLGQNNTKVVFESTAKKITIGSSAPIGAAEFYVPDTIEEFLIPENYGLNLSGVSKIYCETPRVKAMIDAEINNYVNSSSHGSDLNLSTDDVVVDASRF